MKNRKKTETSTDMKSILKLILVLFFFFPLTYSGYGQQKIGVEQLRENFLSPPMKAWPKTYWWWLNGNIDTVRIRAEIKSMKQAGLSGFDIFEIGAPGRDTIIPTGEITFMGEDFLQAVKVAVHQAAEFDMTVGLNMASSWNAGGSWVTPQYAAKSIYYSKIDYQNNPVKLPFPELIRIPPEGKIILAEDQKHVEVEYADDGKPAFYQEIAVVAVPESDTPIGVDEVIDVSSYFDPKTEVLSWPETGDYSIYRFICSNSGEQLKLPSINSKGPIIDHFDARATEMHFNHIIDRLKKVLGNDLGQTALRSLYLASYEALGNVWTESLPVEFEQLNGYDIRPYLPALFDKTLFPDEQMRRFRKDFQLTLSELMINNFYRKGREISNANGLLINSESGGPGFPLHNVPVEPLKSLGAMNLPRGEFWVDHHRFNNQGLDILRVVKEVSAASHIYGRGVVEEEAFTTFQHWQNGPFEIKPFGDRAFCEGMNKVVVHGSSHNPSGIGNPGIVYHAGTHYNDKRVWWPLVKPFNQYLSRISHVLQQSEFVADVLYYYGDAVPNFAGHKNGRFTAGPGYDYEVVNTEILLQTTVEDGELILPTGGRFKVLAMEYEEEINPEVLHKIKELASQGATILSQKPTRVAVTRNWSDSKTSKKDIDKLWLDAGTSASVGGARGKVYANLEAETALLIMGMARDFDYEDADFFTLDYIHYTNEGTHFYLVRNTTDQWISRECRFRQTNSTPELWDPVSGEIVAISVYQTLEDQISIPLTLAPYQSYFVVFSPGSKSPKYLSVKQVNGSIPRLHYTSDGLQLLERGEVQLIASSGTTQVSNFVNQQPLSGAWEVYFEPGQDAPERYVFPDLHSWTESEHEGIRYYSGIARYAKTFQHQINSLMPGQTVYLDLGELSNVGEVWLNGESLGVVWAKPYRVNVTEKIKAGDNLLEVRIANTWSNRLKGDAVTGKSFTFTNITETVVPGMPKTRVPWKDVPLLRSGLLGPVRLEVLRPVD